jgi:sialate O-acetylesterase
MITLLHLREPAMKSCRFAWALIVAVAAAVACGSAASAAEKLSLAGPFTDHGVLQREMAVPVWGKAEPGRKITVRFADQEKTAEADAAGKWSVTLDPLSASAEGRSLIVTTATGDARTDEKLERTDLLVGEVWICSGQSNMGWSLSNSDGGKEAIAAAGDAQLRLFNAHATAVDEPTDRIGGAWTVDSPATAPGFSGVAYFFGKELRQHVKVPVGLIKSAVGGTVAEAWTPRGDLEMNPTLKPLLDRQAALVAARPEALAAYQKTEPELLAKWEAAAAKAKAAKQQPPRKPSFNDPLTNVNRPTGLYNGSIAPLVPYAARGVIWYQGESNSGRGKEYQTLFPAMIGAWRKAWGRADLPFYFVQITPHNGMSPEVREAQRITVETTPNTAMAVTVDVGDAADIHPKQKQPVGARLALAARALTYGEAVEYSGPTYDSIRVEGNTARVTFKHTGGGLVAKDGDKAGGDKMGGELRGFTIAGADGKYAPATAKIDGDAVLVSSESVAAPVAVRYGWANVPDVNLWNKAGLPASPFQSDRAFTLEPGFELLANGTDLTGWQYQNGPAFDGKPSASDGRYTARDGRIVVNPGKGLAQLWTTRQFGKDFHLKLEFRAGVNADSGVFLRKPQLQCRDYLVAGPFKELKNYRPQDWNELEVIVKGDTAVCTCNGEPLPFTAKLPATGPIGLEADRGQMEYRRIRVKE